MEEQGEKEIEKKNKGKLILDATVAPSDIKYPTDLGLLNLARKITEKLTRLPHITRSFNWTTIK